MNPDFDQKIRLSPHAMSDLRWVIENISQLNGFMFGNRPPDVYIECDASLQVGVQSAIHSRQMVDDHF